MNFSYYTFKENEKLVDFPEKRDCFTQLSEYINNKHPDNKVCVLFGLRRTGKTTMISQCIQEMPKSKKEKTISILCQENTEFIDVKRFIMQKMEEGYKYFFIDEVTKMEDFQKLGSVLSDYLVAMRGAKIVLSGTDSLGFVMASKDELYDRMNIINTTYVSFPEYSRLTGEKDILNYIKYGSTLSPKTFINKKTSEEYLETAVVGNIVRSIEKSSDVRDFPVPMTDKYPLDVLESTIQKMINLYPKRIILRGLNRNFSSAPLGSATQILEKEGILADPKQYPDKKEINRALIEKLNINESYQISENDVLKLKIYLENLGLIAHVDNYSLDNETKKIEKNDMEMLCYPGLYHANIKYLLNELRNEKNWDENRSLKIVKAYIDKASEWAEGEILENSILCDIKHMIGNRYDIFKLDYGNPKKREVDLAIQDRDTLEIHLFEVKRSDKISEKQEKNLASEEMVETITKILGNVRGKYVLYNGETKNQSIPRLSVSEFLNSIYNDSKQQNFKIEKTIRNLLDDGTKVKKNIEASIHRIDEAAKELSKHNAKDINRR